MIEKRRVAVADIGGTNARFAIATIDRDGGISLSEPVVLPTDDFPSFQRAWGEFDRRTDAALPAELAIAFAGPVEGETIKLTNSAWQFSRDDLVRELALDRLLVINDLGAIAHAVAVLPVAQLPLICGPDGPMPTEGVISVVGLGTGLGLAALVRQAGGLRVVLECEGGHVDYAPHDDEEAAILATLRRKFGRVSAERLVSGPGLRNILEAMDKGRLPEEDSELWKRTLKSPDDELSRALDVLLANFGSIAGDFALAHGADGVVLAGGLTKRIVPHIERSRFHERFVAKGRFAGYMQAIPVRRIDHPFPGLLGASAAMIYAPA